MPGLWRLATRAAMYRALRTRPRPPQTMRLPRHVPLSQLSGASPTKLAMRLRSSRPSSGTWASSETVLASWPIALAKFRTGHAARDQQFPAATGVQDDQPRRQRLEPGDQRVDPVRVVGDLPLLAARANGYIQPRFGDV